MANLTQLKMLEGLNGFLLVDKPEGIAFSSVVKTVKRKFNLVKVGHGGSLDAMASGLMVLLINDANRFVNDVMGADREYEGRMEFGRMTDTGDIHGREVPLTVSSWNSADFKGDIFQTEPRYCSVRREGTAQYEIADTGEHSQFLTHIYRFDIDVEGGAFRLSSSKNLIVRALANDIGAVLVSLRRTKIGRFSVDRAIAFDKLLEMEQKDFPSCVISISDVLR